MEVVRWLKQANDIGLTNDTTLRYTWFDFESTTKSTILHAEATNDCEVSATCARGTRGQSSGSNTHLAARCVSVTDEQYRKVMEEVSERNCIAKTRSVVVE